MNFDSPKEFAVHLLKLSGSGHKILHRTLEKAAEGIRDEAKEMIGHYQQAEGPYPAWSPLAKSTEQEKKRLGYKLDSPLLRTGDMRKSIESKCEGLSAAVGSNDEKIKYHELGTERMPPRPVFGPSAHKLKPRMELYFATVGVAWLIGKKWAAPRKMK